MIFPSPMLCSFRIIICCPRNDYLYQLQFRLLINFKYYRERTRFNVSDPCLPVGLTQEVKDTEGHVHFLHGLGEYEACSSKLVKLLNRNASIPCEQAPCSMNGVHQPMISFHNSEFYGFSEFWYTMDDVFRIGGIYNFEKFKFEAKVSHDRILVKSLLKAT